MADDVYTGPVQFSRNHENFKFVKGTKDRGFYDIEGKVSVEKHREFPSVVKDVYILDDSGKIIGFIFNSVMEGRGSINSFSEFDGKKVRFRGFVKEPLRETQNSIYPWVRD